MNTPALLLDLQARGLIAQTTKGLEEHLATGSRTLYCGFDPSADSLHIGSLVPLLTLKRFQQHGHRPVVLVGGATGMIGDPSFKAQERKLNDETTIKSWVEKLKTQTSRFVSFEAQAKQPAALMANNYDWTKDVTVLEFLRDIGKHFSVNAMIARDAVKSRLEREDTGISFTEFSYALLQAFDFHELYRDEKYKCTIQIGGSDQWGNITAGTELIRKKLGGQAYALTLPLVTKSDGTKFGKTESGTIWLDASKTSPYAFYQFWLNTADADVEKFLMYFSFSSIEKIAEVMEKHKEAPEKRHAQNYLASEITDLVHGEEKRFEAFNTSLNLFDHNISVLTENNFAELARGGIPSQTIINYDDSTEVGHRIFENEPKLSIIGALIGSELASSKREAREFIEKGAISHNGQPVTTINYQLTTNNSLFSKYHLLRRGKKNYALLVHA